MRSALWHLAGRRFSFLARSLFAREICGMSRIVCAAVGLISLSIVSSARAAPVDGGAPAAAELAAIDAGASNAADLDAGKAALTDPAKLVPADAGAAAANELAD